MWGRKPDGTKALPNLDAKNNLVTSGGSDTTLADGKTVGQISSTMQKGGDNFSGAALDGTKWEVITDTGGMTKGFAGGAMTIGMGTTALARYKIRSKGMIVTNPINLLAFLSMSQRINGNEVRISLIEVDPTTGVAIAHSAPTATAEYQNKIAMLLKGTNATTAYLETICESSAVVERNSTSMVTVAALAECALELRPDDATFTTRVADSATSKPGTPVVINSQIPAMNRAYKLEIDFYNATAPATNTSVVLNRVVILDIQEVQAEVNGRGNASAHQGVPVTIVGSIGFSVTGGVAHDGSAGSVSPVLIGGYSVSAAPSAVSAGSDAVRTQHDMTGRIICEIGGIPQSQTIFSNVALTGTTETAMFAANANGRNRLSSVWIKNKDNITHTYTIREGLAGTVFREITLAAGAERDVLLPNDGVNNSAINRAWTIQVTEASTTGSMIIATSKIVLT